MAPRICVIGLWHQGIVAAACLADFGYTVFASSPADFRTFIGAYTEKWAKVIKFSGAKIY